MFMNFSSQYLTQIFHGVCKTPVFKIGTRLYACYVALVITGFGLQPPPRLPGSFVHGFSQQEYWRELPCPPPGDLPHPGFEPAFPLSPALAGWFFTASATWEAQINYTPVKIKKQAVNK